MRDKCQLCGGSDFYKLMGVDYANFSSRIANYDIYRCKCCGLAVMHPFPTLDDIEELYVRENVFSKPYSNPNRKSLLFPILEPLYNKYGADGRFIAQTSLKLAEKHETLLDIGCSTGGQLQHFLSLCSKIQAVGIDIDPQAKANAPDSIKPHIIIDDFTKHEFDQKFDVITLKFVVEHLLDFRPYIEKIASLLNPGGIFFLGTPDIDSPKARQTKADWQYINDPYQKIGHLRWFNRESLHFLAEKYGLKILKITSRGELLHHLHVKLQNILVALLGRDETGRRFIRYYAPRMIYALIFDAVLSQRIGYGESLYVFMVKKERTARDSREHEENGVIHSSF